MGESYFWKPFAQGVATPIVLIGGTNLLLKDFKVSNPYLYWGGLAASSAIVVGILADKIKVPILNAESFEAEEGDDCPSCANACKHDDSNKIKVESIYDYEIQSPSNMVIQVTCLDCGESGTFYADEVDWHGEEAKLKYSPQIAVNMMNPTYGDLRCSRCNDRFQMAVENHAETFEAEAVIISGKMPRNKEEDRIHIKDVMEEDGFIPKKIIEVHDVQKIPSVEAGIPLGKNYSNHHKFADTVGKMRSYKTNKTNKCFICSKPATRERGFTNQHGYDGEGTSPRITDERGSVWFCKEHDNLYDFGLFSTGNLLAWTHPNGTKYVQGLLLKEKNAETFNADSTPRFIPVEVIKYDAWWTRRYGREYNPTLFGNDYDDSYAVCVRDIPIAHFDTKEKAENHANTVRTAISVLGGVTPSKIDHPLALREMDGYADKNIRGGYNAETTMTVEHKDGSKYRYSETDPIYGEMGGIVGHVSEIKDEKDTPYQKIYGRDVTRGHNFHLNDAESFEAQGKPTWAGYCPFCKKWRTTEWSKKYGGDTVCAKIIPDPHYNSGDEALFVRENFARKGGKWIRPKENICGVVLEKKQSKNAETFNSDSHTDSFMADMPVNAVKNNDGWYIPSVHRNDYKEIFKNWSPKAYPYEKRITQDSVNEACNSCGKEKVHYQFYLAQKNSVNPKMRFIDNATYCQYDINSCGGNICGDCAENASCENCGADICTYCEEENNYHHSDLVCVDCREFNESLEDD